MAKKTTIKSDGKLINITQQQVNKLLETMKPGKKYKSGELCEVLGLKETRMKEILR
jgi:hypothetical protein